MSKPKVVIIDYGAGNLLSVQRAVEACGADWITTSESNVIAQADRIILPGVGAFANGMQALESLGLIETIKAVAADGTPLMGICLGMQLLLSESEEYGLTKGLGIIPGRVVQVPTFGTDGARMKIPHIGWNSLFVSEYSTWNNTIIQNLTPGDAVYFVHSFQAEPEDLATRIAECFYGGCRISAVIANRNVVGCQFHPEKSGEIGLKIIKEFLNFQPNKLVFG
jgi:glutamine amidotransferase